MTIQSKPSPEQILQARADNPKTREREFAQSLNISEADFIAAHCGLGEDAAISARHIDANVEKLLQRVSSLGEVMALTRNESVVHEKIGPFEKAIWGPHASLVLGQQIDLRIFPKHWVHGFAVRKNEGGDVRRSLQFFDAAGEAVHKIHLRPASNVDAYEALVAELLLDDQSASIETKLPVKGEKSDATKVDIVAFRERWGSLTDVHQFVGLLKDFGVDRHQAVHLAGQDFAWRVDLSAVEAMMNHAVQQQLPIMCFVGSRGCIQIHTGPIHEIKMLGPWLNVLDPTFHMHLRVDHIADAWVVRKPTKDGHVTSLEAYDTKGELIVQFFGERHEGEAELADWRMIAENLPRLPQSSAA
ncbi:ChuX/HutX family heme-like substrate-binding protein [Brucella sp. BE17]|uniref:hemin-degrading factor n=1 Tax=Brucella sp. BE17 TaxID=3142977 RepID=UPI0031BAF79D